MAMDVPTTRYVQRPDGIAIAYQVFGTGPRDLIYIPGFISHLELMWAEPGFVRFMERLSSFARVIFFDKPGTGLSDPLPHVPTVEERAGDVRCVLAAAGSERAVVMGFSEGGASAAYLAATAPQLVERLILYGAVTRITIPTLDEALEMGMTAEAYEERCPVWERDLAAIETVPDHWGEGAVLRIFAPSLRDSAVQRRLAGVLERSAASPGMARGLLQAALATDVSSVLGSINVPTLVLHRTGDVVPVELARHTARLIRDARLVELSGSDHAFWLGDPDPAVDAVEEFVTGSRSVVEAGRVLASVLFSDIVGSTERAADLGDAAWTSLLRRHDDVLHREIPRFGGRLVKSTGDGVLATFGGPARAVAAAEALRAGIVELGLGVRIGIHTGECEIGADDIGGIAVHIAARVMAQAKPGEVLVSGTVHDLVVGSQMQFTDRGVHELRGVPGEWRLFAVGDAPAATADLDGPRDHMRLTDRAVVQLVRRVPRVMRLANRISRAQAAS
ncbi:MAG: adenylate/guanylate cyclase domain-containing protein [Acidimicrobiales bacterium]|nr:adenylate/guanylate cyclase domain-containing protein [Acidimicrobiales bacterium]